MCSSSSGRIEFDQTLVWRRGGKNVEKNCKESGWDNAHWVEIENFWADEEWIIETSWNYREKKKRENRSGRRNGMEQGIRDGENSIQFLVLRETVKARTLEQIQFQESGTHSLPSYFIFLLSNFLLSLFPSDCSQSNPKFRSISSRLSVSGR